MVVTSQNHRDNVEQMLGLLYITQLFLYFGFIVCADKLVLTQAMLRCAAELKISLVFDMTFIRG